MELRYHPGDEYVPSFECESLQTLVYVRFTGCEVTHVATCYPWNSPNGVFPVLLDGRNAITDVDQIVSHLRIKGFDLDSNLSAEERADSLAFKSFCRERLLPAMLYLQWMDSTNYIEFTRQWYSRQLSFPLTPILPQMAFRRVENRLTSRLSCVSSVQVDGNELLAKAMHCLDMLSWQLGNKHYMLGDSPTSLDAVVFAHLCIVIQQPLPGTNALWKHLHSLDNLVRYCGLIRKDYFPELSEAPHPDVQVTERPNLTRTLTDPGTWAILGVGAAFLVLQFMRYRSSGSRTHTVDLEELDFKESNPEEPDSFMPSA